MAPGRLPRHRRRGFPDFSIDGCFNPRSHDQSLRIHVLGERLDHLQRYGLPGFEEAKRFLKRTVQEPHSVFETVEGEYLFCRDFGTETGDDRRLFVVRVRATGWKAYVWNFERPDLMDPSVPLAQDDTRISRRLK